MFHKSWCGRWIAVAGDDWSSDKCQFDGGSVLHSTSNHFRYWCRRHEHTWRCWVQCFRLKPGSDDQQHSVRRIRLFGSPVQCDWVYSHWRKRNNSLHECSWNRREPHVSCHCWQPAERAVERARVLHHPEHFQYYCSRYHDADAGRNSGHDIGYKLRTVDGQHCGHHIWSYGY